MTIWRSSTWRKRTHGEPTRATSTSAAQRQTQTTAPDAGVEVETRRWQLDDFIGPVSLYSICPERTVCPSPAVAAAASWSRAQPRGGHVRRIGLRLATRGGRWGYEGVREYTPLDG